MKFALLIHEDDSWEGRHLGSAAFQVILERHGAFSESLKRRGIHAGGAGLERSSTARTIRRDAHGIVVHDGPFAETKEQLGGFCLIDVPDMAAAMRIAEEVPLAVGGSIEVRQVFGGE